MSITWRILKGSRKGRRKGRGKRGGKGRVAIGTFEADEQ